MAKARAQKTKASDESLLDAAAGLIANSGWEAFRLSELAKQAGVSLSDVYATFPDRADVLSRFLLRLHGRAGSMPTVDHASPARDRLFDSIMQVFDAAADEKPVLRVLARDLPRDPVTLLALWSAIERILDGIMDRAAMPLTGVLQPFRMLGLAGIVVRALGTWVDDGPDQAKTMAQLDGDLRRVEPLLERASPSRPPQPESSEESRDTLH
jgi:AcrR family transcriptional regulator